MKSSLRLMVAAIAMAAMLSACGDDEPSDSTATSAPTPTATAPTEAGTGFSTDEVSATSESFGQLTDVRVAKHSGFDRVVLEFANDVPGYTVQYVDLPVAEDGSGEPVELPDARAAVQISLTPASGFDMDAGEKTYTGPQMIANDEMTEITGVASAGDFESLLSWAVGLRSKVPFKVATLDSPARLVIDFQTE